MFFELTLLDVENPQYPVDANAGGYPERLPSRSPFFLGRTGFIEKCLINFAGSSSSPLKARREWQEVSVHMLTSLVFQIANVLAVKEGVT